MIAIYPSGGKIIRLDVDRFEAVITRENRQRGFSVAFGYTADAVPESAALHKKRGRIIKLITVQEILEEEIARKLA